MTAVRRSAAALIAVGAMAALSTAAVATPAPAPLGHVADRAAAPTLPLCRPARGLRATCYALFGPVAPRRHAPTLTPRDIAAAYELPAHRPGSGTVAIVDGFDDPKAEHDLATYRARFGLPPCTTANGCFRKVNQRGGRDHLPRPDPGWGVEISLDLDAVSAACPGCHILLVEGDDPDIRSLGIAEDTAVRLGADAVSNSYGLPEFNGMRSVAGRYYHHRVPIIVSSGDAGFGIPSFPAVLGTTVAVGGTSLQRAPGTSRGWDERAWDFASSGCSGYIAKPAWQTDTHCPTRMVADVSAVADPRSGFLVRDTFGLGRQNGYIRVGGTSLSTPLIAGMVVRSGNESQLLTAQSLYAHPGDFHDVRGGSNGYCGSDYLCTGVSGYDGPTGVGSPHGLGGI